MGRTSDRSVAKLLQAEKASVLYYLSNKKSVEKEREKKRNKKERKGED